TVSDKFIDELRKSIDKRKKGKPMRLLYDSDMPFDMLNFLVNKLKVNADGLIPGNKYHRFGDFIAFPNVGGSELEYPYQEAIKVNGLHRTESLFKKIAEKD